MPAKTTSPGTRVARPNQSGEAAQTLDRGLHILRALHRRPEGMSTTEVAEALGLHRSIAHRLLTTLAAHDLVSRRADLSYELGVGLVQLAEGVEHDLRAIGQPVLADLAETVGATAEMAVCRGDKVVTLLVVEPLHAQAHVSFRPGLSHPVGMGSSGIAILAARGRQPNEPAAVSRARAKGYAVSRGEIVRSVTGVHAAFVDGSRGVEACIGVSLLIEPPSESIGHLVRDAARIIGSRLGA